jgi:chromosome partitioning protein
MILAVANRKGGVGKTTVSVALATHLAQRHKVLLIDLDSQANATESLGCEMRPDIGKWLTYDDPPDPIEVAGLYLIPGHVKTEKANSSMAEDGDYPAIKRGLTQLDSFDFVIMDCPPSISMITRAAVYAADYVLCPTLPEYLSVAGVRQLVTQVSQMKKQWNLPVRLLGIQPNMYRRTTKEHRSNLIDMVKAYGAYGQNGGRVWPPLRQSVIVSTATAEGRPLWDLLEEGKVRREWEAMVERVEKYG